MSSANDEQYTTDKNLRARSNINARYSGRKWFEWIHQALDLSVGSSVLDVGCGMGWFCVLHKLRKPRLVDSRR